MKKNLRKIIAFALTLTMIFSMSAVVSSAAEEPTNVLEGGKTSQLIERVSDKYKVTVQVPGGDGVEKHDEVILMVDGSYSGDDEWGSMKATIVDIAKTVLNENGNTVLTLMAFGMGDNEVIVHAKTAGEVESYLGTLPGSLLYGRSSTNCEAGFTGVEKYIKNHDDSLNNAYVIYISDANINTHEAEHDFYNWRDNSWLKFTPDAIVGESLYLEVMFMKEYGTVPSEAFTEIFGEVTDYDNFMDTAKLEDMHKWADAAWEDVYAYSKLTAGTEYPVSVVERAFVKYDKEHNTHVQDAFYYTLIGRSYDHNSATGVCSNRTVAAGESLAKTEKVEAIYMVETDNGASPDRSAWAKKISADNYEYLVAENYTKVIEVLENAKADLATTPYNNVSVTDYMSKWVKLAPETIKIYEKDAVVAEFDTESSDIVNGVYKYKWTGEAHSAKEPVVLELVPQTEYEAGGTEVVGNTNGNIYKITWNIKDGALVRSDNYRMEYEVTVDTEETGFEYNKEYAANGTTEVTYTDEKDEEKKQDIDVPDVDVPRADLPPDYYLEDNTTTTEDGKGDLPDDQYMMEDDASETESDDETQTGDDTPMGALLAAALTAMAAMIALRRKTSTK